MLPWSGSSAKWRASRAGRGAASMHPRPANSRTLLKAVAAYAAGGQAALLASPEAGARRLLAAMPRQRG